MTFAVSTSWPIVAEPASADRDRFHRIALHEARIATERHETQADAPAGLVDRLIAAFRREPVEPECATCAA